VPVLDSQPWRCVEAVPAIAFGLQGNTSVRSRKTWISSAEGIVTSAKEGCLWIEDVEEVALTYAVPESIDLSRLVGARVRATLTNTPIAGGPAGQLLTLTDYIGRILLVGHYGPAPGNTHSLGATQVRAALSQRHNGPIAFGTAELQCLVHVGEHVEVSDESGSWVMELVARTAVGYAAYVIVDRRLYR
jgi:translation elongation factor EF-1beta